ncbi:uncharacterized protein LOC128546752 [Mercenaria mercenaria]|uniref:uncharacterized protein LOC128546752 n=1 Tax=Mercenaria mercenaria TaxID=6596 RepID=UPI00234F063D|nr:uncharacterized protein LOC128546752 [Mercenaria mercenaria]
MQTETENYEMLKGSFVLAGIVLALPVRSCTFGDGEKKIDRNKNSAGFSLTVISPLGESRINDLDIPVDFECNTEVTLLCEIKPYIDSMSWQIHGETYALCIYNNCVTYPPFPENHIFTMDVASGVFSLTVDPVTNSTNYNIYKCDDGITARSVEAQVKDVKDCHIYIIIIIILAVRFQSLKTLISGYSLYKTFSKDGHQRKVSEQN